MKTNNWEIKKLKDICEQVDYGFTASANQQKVGPKFLRITDIVPQRIEWDNVPYCSIDNKSYENYKLSEGDIVIARTGATTGYAKYIKKPPDSIFASYLVRIKVNNKENNSKYVGLIIESDIYKNFIKQNIGGSAQPQANAQILTSYPISLPPFPIQHKIASILSAYDDLIELNEQRIKILEEMARLIYKEWFVKFRFPGYEKANMVESELGMIPEGWEVRRLGEVFDVRYGKNLPTKNILIKGEYPVYGASNVIGFYNKFVVDEKVALVSCRGNGSGNVFRTREEKAYITNNSLMITPKQDFKYFKYSIIELLLKHSNVKSVLAGSAQPQITIEGLSSVKIIKPTQEIVVSYCDNIEPLVCLIDNLYMQNSTLRQTRDMLLPKLISGEIEVSELDIEKNL